MRQFVIIWYVGNRSGVDCLLRGDPSPMASRAHDVGRRRASRCCWSLCALRARGHRVSAARGSAMIERDGPAECNGGRRSPVEGGIRDGAGGPAMCSRIRSAEPVASGGTAELHHLQQSTCDGLQIIICWHHIRPPRILTAKQGTTHEDHHRRCSFTRKRHSHDCTSGRARSEPLP